MATFEDRSRDSVKRDDPKEKDPHGAPQADGDASSDKYSREGQSKDARRPGEESNADASGQGSRPRRDRSPDMDDRS